jgi:uncharacterized surface protein with fasciclin (FAS1) repeats
VWLLALYNNFCYTYDIFDGYTTRRETPYNYVTAKAAMSSQSSKLSKEFIMKSVSKIIASVGLIMFAASCGMTKSSNDATRSPEVVEKNIVEVAQESGNFKTLLQAATAAGLADTLATTDNLTVFAPTDEAFAKIPAETLDALLKDTPALRDVLTYHVVGAKVPASVAVTLTEATMLNGKKVTVRFDGQDLFINNAKVIAKDIPAKNGVIHVIDTVLLP